MTPFVRCEKLSKWYGGVLALKDVTVEFGRGAEIVGLVGDNGAGKSTLIKILSGAHPADQGRILVDGREVRIRSPRDSMNAGIETIYQYTAMVPAMSIARNIFIGREITRGPRIAGCGFLDRTAMGRIAVEALAKVELHLRSPETPVQELSGGERQGVAIARAIHFRSKMLVLDEPTNHLSVKETNKVLEFVVQLREQGISSIFISHNLHHVYPISDRIVVMARGEKIADVERAQTSVDALTRMIV
ncbi:ATP-binding cassette domain-containing protein [Vineibacter terrae]|uniref:ATP-binding cassette domain-containing protein n=1 Tax=Vineibacter terrae TaxID=2586908 RepID=UPI002E34BD31|nr:ATP-binding cassette domain-containing protein [Vineibacter terrae]HEX2889249.1 ATP-binding cassette domain-containing protein [Vineibacter terrae]